MAITSFDVRKEGRTSERTSEGRTYTETWVVKSDSRSDEEDLVYAHPSCPTVGQLYSVDTTASCTNVQVNARAGTGTVWDVVATYRNNQKTRTNYSWSFTPIREVVMEDVNNNPVCNSAGDPFSPGIERDIYIPTVKVTRSEQATVIGGTLDMAVVANLIGGVNTIGMTVDGFLANPGEALLKDVQAVDPPDIDGVGAWITVTYTLLFKNNNATWVSYEPSGEVGNAHQSILLDAGMHYWSGTKREPCRTSSGDTAQQPMPLDGNGGQLITANPASLLGSIKYRAFKIHPSVNLNQLGL